MSKPQCTCATCLAYALSHGRHVHATVLFAAQHDGTQYAMEAFETGAFPISVKVEPTQCPMQMLLQACRATLGVAVSEGDLLYTVHCGTILTCFIALPMEPNGFLEGQLLPYRWVEQTDTSHVGRMVRCLAASPERVSCYGAAPVYVYGNDPNPAAEEAQVPRPSLLLEPEPAPAPHRFWLRDPAPETELYDAVPVCEDLLQKVYKGSDRLAQIRQDAELARRLAAE